MKKYIASLIAAFIMIPAVTIKTDRINPVCVSTHLQYLSPSLRDKQLSLLQQAGANWVRLDFEWIGMEKAKGQWDFSVYDAIMNGAKGRGMQVVAMLPQWGQPTYKGVDYMATSSPADYAYYVASVSAHFKGNIKLYELGNEPNEPIFWPSGPNEKAYTSLMVAGYEAIKASDPSAKAMSAGLSPNSNWPAFVRSIFTDGGVGHFDYLGYHPYSWPASPDNTTTAPAFSDLQRFKSIQAEYGDTTPIMATEFGWPSTAQSGGVSQTQQATYISRVFTKIMNEDYQFVKIACVYDLVDDGNNSRNSEYNFGLVKYNYTKKPSFTSVQSARSLFNSKFNQVNP